MGLVVADPKHRLFKILAVRRSDVGELRRLGRTLDAWRDELLAYWTATGTRGVDNGPTEAINALIKTVKRVWHGLPEPGELLSAATSQRRS